eukprot:c31741_g1_i1 orf=75-248(+)
MVTCSARTRSEIKSTCSTRARRMRVILLVGLFFSQPSFSPSLISLNEEKDEEQQQRL